MINLDDQKELVIDQPLFPNSLRNTDGYFKIGKTKNPSNRIATFKLELPFDVEYTHVIPCQNMHQVESYLHGLFASKRVRGEWFNLSDQDVALLKAISQME